MKIVGLSLLVIVVLAFATRILGSSLTSLTRSKTLAPGISAGVPQDDYAAKEIAYAVGSDAVALSVRNIMPEPPRPNPVPGDNAEAFEVTEYSARIETQDLEKTCGTIAILKDRADVIFENASVYDKGCNYTFKVKNEKKAEILSIIQGLDPRELSENTYTIKRLVEDFTSQLEILEKKKVSIEETLDSALASYNEITEVARQSRNADALATIIDSKVRIIERLTQERISVNAQIDQLSRAKAEQLDRLEYTYFYVNVIERTYVDVDDINDSWRMAVRDFVMDINQIGQDITIGLLALLLLVAQYGLYLFIVLILAKYGWKLAKAIWRQ